MSITLQILLILGSISTFSYIMRKIKKSQMNIDDSLFWILFSLGLFVMSVFPKSLDKIAKLVGVESTVNLVFLIIIFILVIKIFSMTLKISKLNNNFKNIAQKMAISENKRNVNEKNKEV